MDVGEKQKGFETRLWDSTWRMNSQHVVTYQPCRVVSASFRVGSRQIGESCLRVDSYQDIRWISLF